MLSTDRMKDLEISTLRAMRAMRSVFCRTLRQKIAFLAVPRSADFDYDLSKPFQTPL